MSLDQIVKLISKDCLSVSSEMIIFECVLKWVNHDYNKRVVHLPKLIENVRFGLLNERELNKIADEPMIKKNSACLDVIMQSIKPRSIDNDVYFRARVPLGLPKVFSCFAIALDYFFAKFQIFTDHVYIRRPSAESYISNRVI